MKSYTKFLVMLCALAIGLAAVPAASAATWSRKSKVTFSAPFEVPGVGAQVLPAGTYTFKLLASDTDRHIVQIYNENEDHLFTTILAVANFRLKPTGDTVITFKERAQGEPPAIRAWFYPGLQSGEEFVYGKVRATELAKMSNEPVPAIAADVSTADELATVPIETVKPEEAAAPVVVADAAPAPELPHTGSYLPLLAIAGLLSLGAAGFITKYSA